MDNLSLKLTIQSALSCNSTYLILLYWLISIKSLAKSGLSHKNIFSLTISSMSRGGSNLFNIWPATLDGNKDNDIITTGSHAVCGIILNEKEIIIDSNYLRKASEVDHWHWYSLLSGRWMRTIPSHNWYYKLIWSRSLHAILSGCNHRCLQDVFKRFQNTSTQHNRFHGTIDSIFLKKNFVLADNYSYDCSYRYVLLQLL